MFSFSRPPLLIQALPWQGAKAGKCYNNVQAMIHRYGGQFCYGWALTDFGPHRASGKQEPPPLYRRWLNHVVWQDTAGRLWEVTPNAFIDNPTWEEFAPTEFVADPQATFEHHSETEWFTQPTQYVAIRPEGATVVQLLTEAQNSTGDERISLLQNALLALQAAGFQPKEWKLESIGPRTGSIWLIAE